MEPTARSLEWRPFARASSGELAGLASVEDRAPFATLGNMVHAHFNFADLLFNKNPYWDQHVEDEAFGDEFKKN